MTFIRDTLCCADCETISRMMSVFQSIPFRKKLRLIAKGQNSQSILNRTETRKKNSDFLWFIQFKGQKKTKKTDLLRTKIDIFSGKNCHCVSILNSSIHRVSINLLMRIRQSACNVCYPFPQISDRNCFNSSDIPFHSFPVFLVFFLLFVFQFLSLVLKREQKAPNEKYIRFS